MNAFELGYRAASSLIKEAKRKDDRAVKTWKPDPDGERLILDYIAQKRTGLPRSFLSGIKYTRKDVSDDEWNEGKKWLLGG
jgi:hypothetical protein